MLWPHPFSLHGSPLLDAGLVTLNPALSTHPALVCLDLGDCMLGDEALALICGMLPPDGAKSGKNLLKDSKSEPLLCHAENSTTFDQTWFIRMVAKIL